MPFKSPKPLLLLSTLAALSLTAPLPSCGGEPDTSTLNECNRGFQCQAGQSCCEGLCVPVGTVCGADPDTDTTSQPDTDTTSQPDTDTTPQPDTDTASCTPNCSGKQCGDNGCGGTCGACDNGWTCVLGACEQGGPPPALWDTGVWGQSRWAP